ncbi:transposase [Glutamicibacter arilaitensis]|uniref:transposase n=1 Tax=Glutamicibacter arilaitensis TaxID=256701 RepID=UPI00384ED0B4
MPIKYTDSLKTRAIKLVLHAQSNSDSANGANRRVVEKLELSSETLRTWVRRHKLSGAPAPARAVDLDAENKRIRAELAETK